MRRTLKKKAMEKAMDKAMANGTGNYRLAIRLRYRQENLTGDIWQALPKNGKFYLSVHTRKKERMFAQ